MSHALMYRHCSDGPDPDRNLAAMMAVDTSLPGVLANYNETLLDSWQWVLEAPLAYLVAAVEDKDNKEMD